MKHFPKWSGYTGDIGLMDDKDYWGFTNGC